MIGAADEVRGDDHDAADIEAEADAQDSLVGVRARADGDEHGGHEGRAGGLQGTAGGELVEGWDFEFGGGHAGEGGADGDEEDEGQHADTGLEGRCAVDDLEALRDLDDGDVEGNTGEEVDARDQLAWELPSVCRWSSRTYIKTPKNSLCWTNRHAKTGSCVRPSRLTAFSQMKKAAQSRRERMRKAMGIGSDHAYRVPDSSKATIRKAQAERRSMNPRESIRESKALEMACPDTFLAVE